MKALVSDLLTLALGAALALSLTLVSLKDAIVLPEKEWRCIEYMPGSAECAVYEHLSYRGEDDDADPL